MLLLVLEDWQQVAKIEKIRRKQNNSEISSPKPVLLSFKMDRKEQVIQAFKENPSSAIALSKMLSCDACESFARAPIRYCGHHHTICFICYYNDPGEVNCPAKGCKEKLMIKTHDLEVVRAMKLPVPCKNCKNGCPKKGDEKEVEEHQYECEFRFVDSNVLDGGKRMFKDLFSVIDKFMKKNNGKWLLNAAKDLAYRDSIEPDGHIFRVVISAQHCTFIKAYATVFGGETIANRYRVEMRLSSSEEEFTNTHHGPVLSLDVKDPESSKESYWIAKEKFNIFNFGFDYFGEHNKDKNGEVKVPIMVKIIKKELNIPKKDSDTLEDADMETEEK